MAMAIHNAIFALVASSFLVAFSSAHDFVRFGYNDGSTGPKNWGSLSPEFSLCTKGSNQSPINIVKDDAVYNAKLGSLLRDYVATNATLINNGFNVGLRFDGEAGTLVVGGKNYTFRAILWHSPSEHTFDGERFPVELQLIHTNSDGAVAVVAVLYQYGAPILSFSG
uniref:Alpha-carbonic anhydrase domain-containing protein n=1 Tax=Ananas comosus var. bracteatus TaxID=296719 RepID=A0A6V7QWU3_ANACO